MSDSGARRGRCKCRLPRHHAAPRIAAHSLRWSVPRTKVPRTWLPVSQGWISRVPGLISRRLDAWEGHSARSQRCCALEGALFPWSPCDAVVQHLSLGRTVSLELVSLEIVSWALLPVELHRRSAAGQTRMARLHLPRCSSSFVIMRARGYGTGFDPPFF